MDVAAWLNRLGFEQYEQAFRVGDVDADGGARLIARGAEFHQQFPHASAASGDWDSDRLDAGDVLLVTRVDRLARRSRYGLTCGRGDN